MCCILNILNIYTYTGRIHIDAMNKRRAKTSFKKYTFHIIWKVACERGVETEQNCNILTPTLMAISVVSFSFSWCSTGGPGAQLSAGFLYHILSPTPLISNSLGVPRAPSAGWWFSLPQLVSNSSDLQLLTSCSHRVI